MSYVLRHNAEMERELIKMYRENRSSKGDREKASNETRQKKKQHLARCNAAFQPTSLGLPDSQVNGIHQTYSIRHIFIILNWFFSVLSYNILK